MDLKALSMTPDGDRKPLVAPSVIAVVGASDMASGNYYGARVLENLVEGGIAATIYPVNPRLAGGDLMGLAVHASLTDLPARPDMVFVVTPSKAVLPVLEEAARLDVATSVVVTAEGGSEAERRAFRERVAALARVSGMRIIGPNSMGIMNGRLRLNGSFASGTAKGRVPAGGIACLSQSGATISAMLQWFGESKVGFSWLVSTGDESATGIEELMQAMVDDADVRSIMLFLEGASDGAAFRRAALEARRAGKPVTMLQVGKSEKGREAVQSHTGRVAGTKEVFAAVAHEAGIIETQSFEEFFATARTMAQCPKRPDELPRNRRAALITVSGGAASLSADQLYGMGWKLPELTETTVEALAEATGQAGIHNPADIGGVWRDPKKISRAMLSLSGDDQIDTIFICLGAGGLFAKDVALAIVEARASLTQDVFVAWVGLSPEVEAIFESADIPVFHDFPLAVRAGEACAVFHNSQSDLGEAHELLRLVAETSSEGDTSNPGSTRLWTVTETLHDLKGAGLPCADFDVAPSIDIKDIGDRAETIGFPVVLKLSSADLNHKSDEGGVAIRLGDRAAVEAAAIDFAGITSRKMLRNSSVLIQRMAYGIELLVGIKRDPSFGLVLVVGLGGTMAELHAEVAAAILPTSPAILRKLLYRNQRLTTLLDGFRGEQACDREALVSFLADFSEWAMRKGAALQEVDLNPVMIRGDRISIVDARVVWN